VPSGRSTSRIGTSWVLPVCARVIDSKSSSWVPKPPGKMTTASASLTNMSLRVKKKMKVHQLGVVADERVGVLHRRQADVDAEAALPAGALVAGLHDPRSGAGDDHKTRLGELAGD